MKNLILCGTLLLMTISATPVFAQRKIPRDRIAAGFRDVPASAKLRMYWRVFGPTWTPAEADYQFRALKEAGVGGVMTYFTYPVVLDDPKQDLTTQRFLSEPFLQTFGEMARLARTHGLRFGFSGGTGWPYGGPTVSPAQSAQNLRRETLTLSADKSGYALPALRTGEQIVFVSYGGQDVTALCRAGSLPVASLPAVVSPQPSNPLHGAPSHENRLPQNWGTGGAVSPQSPQAFVAGPTRMQVKRPSLGGEGLVVDHYSREAAEQYLQDAVAPLLQAAPGLVESVYCDSLEVYRANWTHDLPAEFRRRRGYDLLPHLPALFEAEATTADIRFDFWRTLAELSEERFTQTTGDWVRQHGAQFEMEAIGTPPNPLTAARYIDMPTGEQYEPEGFSFSRYAASGAHLTGRRIIGTEAWTWAGVPNRLADTLGDLKLLSDIHFLAGCNDLTGVDFPYSPRSAGTPGWLPYYGPAINQNHPQWPHFRALADYTGRCCWLLRQGKPVADIAIYLPVEDSFAHGPTEQMPLNFLLRDHFVTGEKTDEFGLQNAFRHHSDLIHTVTTQGFNFDGIDFFAMERLAHTRRGRLIARDGDYRIVILPSLQGMRLEALEKIAGFCRAGGTVIATQRLPTQGYGLLENRSAKLCALLQRLFGVDPKAPGSHVVTQSYGAGQAIFLPDAHESLAAILAKQRPDVRFTPAQADVGFVHRRVGRRDFYFLANVGNAPVAFTAVFRVGSKRASLWNALDGAITPLPAQVTAEGDTFLRVELAARGSAFVVFEDASSTTPPVATPPPAPLRVVPLSIPQWHVTFDGPDAPPPHDTESLESWSLWPAARYFSGRATYTGTFRYDAPLPQRCLLWFEQIRESADVIVNGKKVGLLWTPPWELDIAHYLRSGENTLTLTVANLPINRFIGLPDEDLGPLRSVYGVRFPTPEEKELVKAPLPSGLIGRVELRVGP